MEETSLFNTDAANQPLAARIRPKTIDDIIGQGHLLGEGRILRRFIENDTVPSMIFWGASGCRQNDVGSRNCRTYEGCFCRFFGCYGRH